MHCDTLKQDNDSTVRGDGGSRVSEVRAGTTSPMPEHKGFKLQLSRDPLTPADGPGSVSVNINCNETFELAQSVDREIIQCLGL